MLQHLLAGAVISCAASLALADCQDEVRYVASFNAPFRAADGTYYMLERYADLEARNAHGSSAEVQAAFPSLGPHLDGRPEIVPVERVCAQ